MDDLSGLRRLMSLLGPEFGMVVSDQTGVYPGEPGVGERLGFIYRWNTVERMEMASDVTYDRSKVIDSIASDYDMFTRVMTPYARSTPTCTSGTTLLALLGVLRAGVEAELEDRPVGPAPRRDLVPDDPFLPVKGKASAGIDGGSCHASGASGSASTCVCYFRSYLVAP